jgi:hypothetical protein
MDRRGRLHQLLRARALAGPGVVLVAVLGLLGCLSPQPRGKSEEETDHDRYQVATVGDKTTVANAAPMQVSGVGLVEGLEGTGAEAPPSEFRTMLEEQLSKLNRERHPRELLRSTDNALVLVSAVIPPGAHKGDSIDITVTLPRDSRATSLRGGRLRLCQLFNYDFTTNLDGNYKGPTSLLKGHPIVWADGPVLVGVGGGDEDGRLRQGRIWGGGRLRVDQPLSLVMNRGQERASMTSLIADRINATFQPEFRGPDSAAVAVARDNMDVFLRVPPQYRLNLPRFLRVVRLVPLQLEADAPGKGTEHRSYRQRLVDDLLDPAQTVTAALRLEALGTTSVSHLRKGLASPHPLVRYCSAEALLYVGSPAGAEEVARAAAAQPLLRAFALTALGSLDEAICQTKLEELLTQARDDETRYGAFRALHTLCDRNPAVAGERLGDAFWLHRVAPGAPPLVHVSTVRRAEIVLFGARPFLRPPFAMMAGEFTVTAVQGDTRCTVSRVPVHGQPLRRQCSLELEDVLRVMADLGGYYPEVVALLQQAERCDCVSCRVRFDALPQAASVYDLVKAGKDSSGGELVPAGQDLGATPTLYERDDEPGPADRTGGKRPAAGEAGGQAP